MENHDTQHEEMEELLAFSQAEQTQHARNLADEYVKRHTAMENYIVAWAFAFRLLRRLRIKPVSWKGHLSMMVLFASFFFGLPVLFSVLAGQWHPQEILRWLTVAITFSVAAGGLYGLYRGVVQRLVSLHRIMLDEEGLSTLVTWERRAYRLRTCAVAGIAFTITIFFLIMLLQGLEAFSSVSIGTIVIGVMLLYQVGEISYNMFMLGVESRILVQNSFDLYRLSPIDTIEVQQSLRGYDGVALLNSLIVTIFIVEFLILLPTRSDLLVQISLILLLLAYVGVGVGVIFPRLAIGRIIQLEKDATLKPLQVRLNDLYSRLTDLGEREFQNFKRLQAIHSSISASSENVFPLGTVGRVAASLLVPTLTFFASVASEVYLGRLLERILP